MSNGNCIHVKCFSVNVYSLSLWWGSLVWGKRRMGCGRLGARGDSGILRTIWLEKEKEEYKIHFLSLHLDFPNQFRNRSSFPRNMSQKKPDYWASLWSLTSDDIKLLSHRLELKLTKVDYLRARNWNVHKSNYSNILKITFRKNSQNVITVHRIIKEKFLWEVNLRV